MTEAKEYVHVPSNRYPDNKAFTLPHGTKIIYQPYYGEPVVVGEVYEGKIIDVRSGILHVGITELLSDRGINTDDAYSPFGSSVRVRNPAGMDVTLSGIAEYQAAEKRRLEREKIARENRELETRFYPGVMEDARAAGHNPGAIIKLVTDKNTPRINRGLGLFEFRLHRAVILATPGGRVAQIQPYIWKEPKRLPRASYRDGRWTL